MADYYYLAISLPRLAIGEVPDLTFQQFETLLRENLTSQDLDKANQVRWLADIENMRRYWLKAPLDFWGTLNENDLEEALLKQDETILPDYVDAFLTGHPSREERLQFFPNLLVSYYAALARQNTGFLRTYALYEKQLRLVLAGYRARLLGRDLAKELQHEDPQDDIVVQLMAQKDSKAFIAPAGFEDVAGILQRHAGHPLELQKALMQLRFDKVEEMVDLESFSIDRILAYMIQLKMADTWTRYDQQKGKEIVDKTVKELE